MSAGVAVDRVLAVDRPGQDAGAGGLAGAAGADEDIGMGEAVVFDLVFKGFSDVLLPDDLIEGLRAPFSIERLIHDAASFSVHTVCFAFSPEGFTNRFCRSFAAAKTP